MSEIEIEYVGSLYGHNGIVTSLVVGSDSNGKPLVISGARDKKIIVWNLDLDHPEEVLDSDNKAREEKIVGKPKKALSGHNHFVSCLDITKDSKFLVSGSWDKTCRLWDLNTFKTQCILTGHTKDVLSVAFAGGNRLILSGSMDNTLKVWDTRGKQSHQLNEFNGWVSSIGHVKRGKSNLLMVGSWDQSVKLYDKDLAFVSNVEGFDYGVVSVATDDEGEFLFAAEKNGKIRVNKLNEDGTAELKSTIDVNTDIHAISYQSKYYRTITSATNKGLLVNEVNKVNKPLYEKTTAACHCLAWDESKTYLFAGFADGAIRIFKFNTMDRD